MLQPLSQNLIRYWASDQMQPLTTLLSMSKPRRSKVKIDEFSDFKLFYSLFILFPMQCYYVYIDGLETTNFWLFLKIIGCMCFFHIRKVCLLFLALFFLRIRAPNEKSSLCNSCYKFCREEIPRKKLLISQLLLTLSPLPAGD